MIIYKYVYSKKKRVSTLCNMHGWISINSGYDGTCCVTWKGLCLEGGRIPEEETGCEEESC